MKERKEERREEKKSRRSEIEKETQRGEAIREEIIEKKGHFN